MLTLGKVISSNGNFMVTDPTLTVYDAACQRADFLFKNFERVIVSFSGGKDSTCALMITLDAARRAGRRAAR